MISPKQSYRVLLAVPLAIALAACTMAASSKTVNGCEAGIAKGTSPAGLDQVSLCLISGKKTRNFIVEVARTSEQQQMGMMFRESVADDHGMIFPFPQPKMASFWMHNTPLALDIIFVRADGTIESIAENAVPYSDETVNSGEPVAAVLELRGGLSSELGIAAGDKVVW